MLTVKQAAAAANVSQSLVYQWIKDQLFAVYRRGGRGCRGKILIDEAAYRAFLESQKVGESPALPLRHIELT